MLLIGDISYLDMVGMSWYQIIQLHISMSMNGLLFIEISMECSN